MKRTAGALLVLAALGGCVSSGPRYGQPGAVGHFGAVGRPREVPGVQGAWGQPIAMAAPYSALRPGEVAAREMMARSIPMDLVQQVGGTGGPGGLMPAVMPASGHAPLPSMPAGVVAGAGALPPGMPGRFPAQRSEVRFANPAGMKVAWFAPSPDGRSNFSSQRLDVPGRYNFVQGAVYRLKLSDIPNRPGVELYPTLEVVPANAKTSAYLAHSAVPIVFTDEDFDQVAAGNYVVKVVYLPDPQFQDLVTTGPDEIVSTRLEPGADPIAEAHRRGNILLIVRLGNIDLEAPNTPPMNAPSPYGPAGCPPGGPCPPGAGMGMGMRMPSPTVPITEMVYEPGPAMNPKAAVPARMAIQPATAPGTMQQVQHQQMAPTNAPATMAMPMPSTTRPAQSTTKSSLRWWNFDKK